MKKYIKVLGKLYARRNGDIIARSYIESIKLVLDGNIKVGDDNIIAHYRVPNYADARGCNIRKAIDELSTYHDSLTAQRSPTATELSYDKCKSHVFNCFCDTCSKLNVIDNKLMDAKRHYKQEVKDEATKTSKESHKEVAEKAIKALFGNSIRRTKVGKDSEFPESCKTSKSNARGNPKIRIIRYIQGSILDELIGQGRSDKLSSSEEPFKVEEVQGDSYRRGSPMDRRVSEDVSAMERFESVYAEYSRHLQLGYIDARNFRKLISNAFTEFMESVGQVSNGQGGLAVQ